jgi:hypothetical protein
MRLWDVSFVVIEVAARPVGLTNLIPLGHLPFSEANLPLELHGLGGDF